MNIFNMIDTFTVNIFAQWVFIFCQINEKINRTWMIFMGLFLVWVFHIYVLFIMYSKGFIQFIGSLLVALYSLTRPYDIMNAITMEKIKNVRTKFVRVMKFIYHYVLQYIKTKVVTIISFLYQKYDITVPNAIHVRGNTYMIKYRFGGKVYKIVLCLNSSFNASSKVYLDADGNDITDNINAFSGPGNNFHRNCVVPVTPGLLGTACIECTDFLNVEGRDFQWNERDALSTPPPPSNMLKPEQNSSFADMEWVVQEEV